MRPISTQLLERLQSSQQTKANNADPAAVVWIRRPTSPLTEGEYLEKTLIGTISSLTACDVAVRRRRAGREPDEVYVAYVADGAAGVKKSAVQADMNDFAWTDAGFSAEAEDVAICFDGKTVRSEGRTEWITDERPFVFTVHDGVLTARILGLLGETELASSNCTKVTAVRATSGGGVDFGLIVFFLLSGEIYYRQRIAGVWTDAAPVTFGPAGVTWADVAAFRTWDYRVGLQAITTTGDVYELFTAFQGIAKHGAENISLDARVQSSLHLIEDFPAQETEHLSLDLTASQGIYGGFYETGAAQIVSAQNVDDGNGDWGKKAVFVFDRHLRAEDVAAQPTTFSIVDSNNNIHYAKEASLRSDGKTVDLGFWNFNSASGACYAMYSPGTVRSMADVELEETSLGFTPANLVFPTIPPPTVTQVASASFNPPRAIIVTLSRPLLAIEDEESEGAHFKVSFNGVEYSPGGESKSFVRTAATAYIYSEDSTSRTLIVGLAGGNQNDLSMWKGGLVKLEYDGKGTLRSQGGPLQRFWKLFTPSYSIPWKPDVAEPEHLSLGLAASGTLTRIYNRLTRDPEHIELSVTAAGTLTHVNDL